MRTLALLIVSVASFIGVAMMGSAGACACAEPPVSDVIYGAQGPADAGTYSATTQDDWEAIWDVVGEAPKGHFEEGQHTAVAVFLGTKPTGGYDVVFDWVSWEDSVVKLEFHEVAPEGPATQAFTSPYVVFILPGSAELVVDRNDFVISPIGGQYSCGGMDEMEMVMVELEAAS